MGSLGNNLNGDINGHHNGYRVQETTLGDATDLRIITVGAGASGLNLAYQMNKFMKNVTHIIYEKNPEVGGTWYENRYPGCACDVPSHNYQFTWEEKPDWEKYYSPAPEILEYFKHVAKKYDLYKQIRLSHQVVKAEWNSDRAIWQILVKDLSTGDVFEDWCDFMITGTGILNNWKWPNIPGLSTFKGELYHSAAWDQSADWKGKTVAVLGCGSSGVQIVPTILPDVKQLITFIRSPTWITAGFGQSKAGPNGANFEFSDEQKQQFKNDPAAYMQYRKEIEGELNVRFKFIIKDSDEQREAIAYSTKEMTDKLGHDNPLLERIIPTFGIGCRRPTPGNGYLEALTAPKVRVVTDEIQEIVPEGIKLTTGEILKVDMFICATGFDISFCPRYPIIGENGIQLGDQWKEKPSGYLSLAVPNFPNHFMFLGPSSPIGHGSVLPIIEHVTKYIVQMLFKCQTQGIRTVAPKQEAVDDFAEHIDEFMQRTTWTTHCRSWFKNGKIDGPVIALHPGSRVHWFHMLDRPRFEDYHWKTSNKNRFSYLGNGFSTREAKGKDSTYYFDDPEEGYENIKY